MNLRDAGIDPADLELVEALEDDVDFPVERRRRISRLDTRGRRAGAALNARSPSSRDECPRPAKATYATKAAAKRALSRLPLSGRDEVQPYRCACGAWHLGHKVPASKRVAP